jgi:broad specificity polyphosphatase/5'/3'-nucleotidase SurE
VHLRKFAARAPKLRAALRKARREGKGYVTYPTKDQVGLTDAWSRHQPTDQTETDSGPAIAVEFGEVDLHRALSR